MHCHHCNRPINNPRFFDGNTYGRACWVKHCLPVLQKRWEAEDEKRKQERIKQSIAIAETFKLKKMDRIKNRFKRDFIPSIIKQVENGGMLSNRQMDIAHDIMSKKDCAHWWIVAVELGIKESIMDALITGCYDPKDFGMTREEALSHLDKNHVDYEYFEQRW